MDPFPEIPPALLNSADFIDYVAATGMIYPFNPRRIKSASYPVKLSGEWVRVDEKGVVKSGQLTHEGQKFTLPRNSIVFMTTEPEFHLPDYIALRHNLKIEHVYKGLLVGTGPLIDPGFSGRLSLPIHNLTNHDYELEYGDEIIWVEATKLSPDVSWVPDLKRSSARKGKYIPYPPERSDRNVRDYIHEATKYLGVPSSSSAKIQKDAQKAKVIARKVERNSRVVTLVGAATIVALVAGVLIPIEIQLVSTNQELQQQVQELRSQLKELKDSLAP
ncbi:dCTP deaminase domain-containing protein [Schumannella luteola]